MPIAPLGLRPSELFPLKQPCTFRCHYPLAVTYPDSSSTPSNSKPDCIQTPLSKPLLTPRGKPRSQTEAPDDQSRTLQPDPTPPNRRDATVPPRKEKRRRHAKRPDPKVIDAQQTTAALNRKPRNLSAACNTSITKSGTDFREQRHSRRHQRKTNLIPVGRPASSTKLPEGGFCCRSVDPPEDEPTRIAYRRTPGHKAPARTADSPPPQGWQRPRRLTERIWMTPAARLSQWRARTPQGGSATPIEPEDHLPAPNEPLPRKGKRQISK
jgi:hypothetical protein